MTKPKQAGKPKNEGDKQGCQNTLNIADSHTIKLKKLSTINGIDPKRIMVNLPKSFY